MRRGTGRRPPVALGTALVALAVGVAACGAGGGAADGEPRDLALSGTRVPVAPLKGQLAVMCAVARQAHADPAGADLTFYRGPHDSLHLLAAVLAPGHRAQSTALLDAMLAFEQDLLRTPPPSSTGTDADALLARSMDGLRALKVAPPGC